MFSYYYIHYLYIYSCFNWLEGLSAILVSLLRDPESPVQRFARAMSENDIYAELPENTEERQEHLADMAVESAAEFLSTHNLEVKLPKETTQSLARAIEEGAQWKLL